MSPAFQRRVVQLEDAAIQIALHDWGGDGPLALLHHANGFCAGVWGLVAEPLRRHFRVIAMDARGHGDSSKPQGPEAYRWERFAGDVVGVALELAAQHGDGRVALGLGHSFGGTSILLAAAERPELFGRCVLVDPVIPPPEWARADPERQTRGRELSDGARNRRHVFPSRDAVRASWQGKELFAEWDPRAFDLYLAEGFRDRDDGQVELKCPGEVEASVFEGSAHIDVWSMAAHVKTPTLIQRAARGHFPRFVYDELASKMAETSVVDIDAGHLAVMERPDLVLEGVLGFAT